MKRVIRYKILPTPRPAASIAGRGVCFGRHCPLKKNMPSFLQETVLECIYKMLNCSFNTFLLHPIEGVPNRVISLIPSAIAIPFAHLLECDHPAHSLRNMVHRRASLSTLKKCNRSSFIYDLCTERIKELKTDCPLGNFY